MLVSPKLYPKTYLGLMLKSSVIIVEINLVKSTSASNIAKESSSNFFSSVSNCRVDNLLKLLGNTNFSTSAARSSRLLIMTSSKTLGNKRKRLRPIPK